MDEIPETRIATFQIRERDYLRVVKLAEAEDRSVSAVLRSAVRDYIEKQKAQKRENA